MAVTRINNNQITDASAGNVYLGIDASTKLQAYSVTAGKIANNLVYGSDLTVSGNLTVNGTSTSIDTTITTIEDPVIVLASTQTGAPAVDIGFIGERGTANNIAFVWQESSQEFITAFTDTSETSTTINVIGYANIHTQNANVAGNLTIGGNIDITGNITNLNVSGNITGGNLLTPGLISAASNITSSANIAGGNILTGGLISATATITGGNIRTEGAISATANVTGGNINTAGNIHAAGTVSATSNITGGNLETGGTVSSVGNITAGSGSYFIGDGSLLTGVAAASVNAGNLVGNTLSANVLYSSLTTVGSLTSLSVVGSAQVGNLYTAGEASATGNIIGSNIATAGNVSATGEITGGNVFTGGLISATGDITGGSLTTAGTANVTGTITGGNILSNGYLSAVGTATVGNLDTAGTVSATGNAVSGNVNTAGLVSATGNIIGGNIATAGNVSATGEITGGNIATAGTVSATGTITGGNLATGGTVSATGTATLGNVDTSGTVSATGTITSSDTITGGNLATGGTVSATGNATVGNINTAGLASVTGNVIGGNIITGGLVTATGNVTGGNITTAGLVSATGNLIGAGVETAQVYGATGLTLATGSGDVNLSPLTGNIVVNTYINGVLTPTQSSDAATKQYVDDAVSAGLTIHTPVLVEANVALNGTYAQGGTTATVTDTVAGNTVVFGSAINPQVNDQLWFTNSFNGVVANQAYFVVSAPNTSAAVLSTTYNGVPVGNITSATGLTQAVRINSGIGATLTNAGANATLVVDGVTLSNTNRVLVYSQANAVQNGVYVVSEAGNATTAWELTRSTDTDVYGPKSTDELDVGDYFFVQSGDSGAGESYVMTAPEGAFIIGYNNITFTQFSASQVYTANTSAGLNLTGTVFSAKIDNNTTAFDGLGNIIVKASANLTTPNIGAATGTSLSATGTITGGNLATGGTVSATGTATLGNVDTSGTVSATGTITGGNLATGGTVSATGNITGGNIISGNAVIGNISLSGDITLANVSATGYISATGNVTGGNLLTSGLVSSTGTVTGGNLDTSGTVSATSTITGGNLATGGTVSATATITGGNIDTGGTVSATGNVTGGNVNTGGEVSATANVTGANLVTGGLVTSTGNIIGGNILTGGLVSSTGTVTGGNLATGGTVSATGTATLGNVATSGTVSATGNITGGNILTSGSGGDISGTGNITGGNILTSGLMSATGNMYAANFIGNVSGNISAPGANTEIVFNDSGIANATAGFTFNKTSNAVTVLGNIAGGNISTLGNVDAGNLLTSGLISATGNVNAGNVDVSGELHSIGNIYGGNLASDGDVQASGNITGNSIVAQIQLTGGNIVIQGDDITDNNGRVNFNTNQDDVDFAVNGDTVANIFYIDGGTGTASFGNSTQTVNAIVAFNASNSILFPVGNIGQRPATGVTGMVRFNTTNNNLEVFDNSQWVAVGVPSFTVITDEQFFGDGSTVEYTLSSTQTTVSCIVAINGVVQIPTSAYSVSGIDPACVLTFTEAPEPGDVIDVREITTTTSVTSISNLSGNAVVGVSDTSKTVNITGDLVPTGNLTANLGSSTNYWTSLYVGGNTIYLGNLQLKAVTGETFAVYQSDGTTQANIDIGNVDVSSITSGTSTIGIGADGNIYNTVSGTANVLKITTTGAVITGTLSTTGNITGSYVLGNGSQLTGIDATSIQNGTSNVKVVSSGGNVTTSVGGTSNVVVVATTGQYVTGAVSASGTVTAASVVGGVITGTSTSVTGTTTAASVVGGVITGTSTSVTGTTTAASVVGGVMTGTSLSASGNVTGGNVNTGGVVSATGNVRGGNLNTDGNVSGNWMLPTTGVSTGGNILVGGYLSVVGNLYVSNVISSQTLTVDDPLLYLVANVTYPYNYDIGFYSAFTGGTGNTYQHTGVVRDYTDNTWKIVSNVPEPAGSAFDFDNAIYDPVKHGNLAVVGNGTFTTTVSATGTITGGNLATGGTVSATGNITGGNLSVGTGTITGGNIVNSNANGVGNIGSSTTYFNTVFAKATSAQYADLAEKYVADAEYAPGTVVVFGGTHEVTVNATDADRKVAGVVSTNPSYTMNGGLEAEHVATVALTGRVPCMVVGPVRKGDLMVSAGLGRARAEADPKVGTVIGKALEDFNGSEGTIEVVVGRF